MNGFLVVRVYTTTQRRRDQQQKLFDHEVSDVVPIGIYATVEEARQHLEDDPAELIFDVLGYLPSTGPRGFHMIDCRIFEFRDGVPVADYSYPDTQTLCGQFHDPDLEAQVEAMRG